jgi:hypothetical protein
MARGDCIFLQQKTVHLTCYVKANFTGATLGAWKSQLGMIIALTKQDVLVVSGCRVFARFGLAIVGVVLSEFAWFSKET